MTATTTYLVMQGIYSDRRVLCSAPDRATAEKIAERVTRVEGGYDAEVVEVPLYLDATTIPCVVDHPYNDDYTTVSWPWSYDWSDPDVQAKVAADAAAKAAAEDAGL